MIVKYCFTLKTLFHGLRIADLVHVGETGALILTFILKHMYLEIVLMFLSPTRCTSQWRK